jgi:hypothetical protein
MAEILTPGRAMGAKVTGEALVATDGFSARDHLVEHPGAGDPALGAVEHQHPADVAGAVERVAGPGEDAGLPVEIVAGGESVHRDQRLARYLRPHGPPGGEKPTHGPSP